MPLRAILVTGDMVDVQLRQVGDDLKGKLGDAGHVEMLRRLLCMDFDHILTTNFSYELEMSTQHNLKIDSRLLRRITRHTDERLSVESRYMLHTYSLLRWAGHSTQLWHIHGEGRVPESMVLGHYYYANLLEKIMEHLRTEGYRFYLAQKRGTPLKFSTWADVFLLGDLYILGFGFDVSEFDLWWLLNRKKKERAETGMTYFFSPAERCVTNEKEELLRVLGVEIHHCDTERAVVGDPIERSARFRQFYARALDEIAALMVRNRTEYVS